MTVETTPLDDVRHILPFTDAHSPLVWLRKGEGIAGTGEALRLEFRGADRIAQASAAWKQLAASSTVSDPVRMPGSGLVAFGTFTFDDASTATSVLVVPRVVIGRRAGAAWITRIRRSDETELPTVPHPEPFGAEYRLTMLPGALTREAYKKAVAK